MPWACIAVSGVTSLVFIDDVTADRSSRKNCEVYMAVLSAQIQDLQMDNDAEHTAKATQEFVKKLDTLQWSR